MTPTADRLAWPAATLAVILGLTAYCQIHSWIDAVETPLVTSLRWGTLAGSAAVLGTAMIWRHRAALVELSSRGLAQRTMVAFTFAAAVLVVGSIVHALTTPAPQFLLRAARHMFDMLPFAAALCALAVAALSVALLTRPKSDAPVRPSWIAMPEEPTLRLRPDEVQLIRSAGNYSEFVANGRSFLVRVPLKAVAERLRPAGFVQIHRTTIVNAGRVRTVAADSRGRLGATLDTGAFVPVSRGFRRRLDDLA